MEAIGELWQQHGYRDLNNWIDGIIAVSLLMWLYYYKCWVDKKFRS
mgnify:CR=1 FL=1